MNRRRSEMSLALGLLALVAALAPAPREPEKKAGSPGELAEARAKVCERMIDYYEESLKAPPQPKQHVSPADSYAAGYEPIDLWSKRLLDARLDAKPDAEARIAALQAEVDRVAKVAGELRDLVKGDSGMKVVVDRVEFSRLEAEYRLAREKEGK